MEIQTEELMISEAATRLGISQRAVRIAIEENRLPARRRGHYWFVRTDDLIAYQHRTQPEGVKLQGRPKKKMDAILSLLKKSEETTAPETKAAGTPPSAHVPAEQAAPNR